jgi:hypothetical protein
VDETSTNASQSFDLGKTINTLITSGADVGKAFIIADAAKSGTKSLAGAGTTGVYLALIAVGGLAVVGTFLVILKK